GKGGEEGRDAVHTGERERRGWLGEGREPLRPGDPAAQGAELRCERRGAGPARVEVVGDDGSTPPPQPPVGVGAEPGRGLHVVEVEAVQVRRRVDGRDLAARVAGNDEGTV